MQILIDIHPDMIGSPKEIGELVEKQMIMEIEGKKYNAGECQNLFKNLINAKDSNNFLEILSGKKIF